MPRPRRLRFAAPLLPVVPVLWLATLTDPENTGSCSSASVTVRGADFSSCSVVATVTGVGALALSTTTRDPVTTISCSSVSAVAAAVATLEGADWANAGAVKRQASAVVVESIRRSRLCRRTHTVSKA